MSKSTRVAIIGCGLIGEKRSKSLDASQLIACADVVPERAQHLANMHGVLAVSRWQDILEMQEVDIVVVATTNDSLAEITRNAVLAGKHVLVEKPAALNVTQIDDVISAVSKTNRLVRVGFNHRYHPSLAKARDLITAGAIGDLMFIRGRYGHGGRLGYEKEWRSDPARSGGGELIDQGVHLIDLSRWFLGDFSRVSGFARTFYWKMPVDDNAFLTLQTTAGRIAFLHVSCTEWKNTFSFEIYGETGKIQIDGLGGSYGLERIAFYKMLPQMGPPETTIWEYPVPDVSWGQEFKEFLSDIEMGRMPSCSLADARAALKIVEEVYRGFKE